MSLRRRKVRKSSDDLVDMAKDYLDRINAETHTHAETFCVISLMNAILTGSVSSDVGKTIDELN